MDFCEDYRPYFAAARHNVADKARCYLAGLLMKAPRKNMERMEEYVEQYNYQNQQQFLSDSPWDAEALVRRIGKDASGLIGGKDSTLIIDESAFRKKGNKSVGVARQWNGRDGKADNCQVGVFAALSDGRRSSLVDVRLYLPVCWTEDEKRCEEAKIPPQRRGSRSKPQLAMEMVEAAVANGLDFGWVGADSLYGSSSELLHLVEDSGKRFVADVRSNHYVYTSDPKPHLPQRKGARGPKRTKLSAQCEGQSIKSCFKDDGAGDWESVEVREGTKGTIRLRARRRRLWVWDGKEKRARLWWALCLNDEASGEFKYALSNAGEEADLKELVRRHSVRYWVERSFQDAKTSVGMGDYQARGWVAWHHHMALVMLAMLFLLKERNINESAIALLSCQDIVELLNTYLPRADATKEQVLLNMERRHRKRRQAIESAQRKSRAASTALT